MGNSASKKVEEKLTDSPVFQTAVEASFQECLALSQHSSTGIFLWQLLDASCRVYHFIPPSQHAGDESSQQASPQDEDLQDPASLIKLKWLTSPPSQFDVDRTLRKEGLGAPGKKTLTRDEFHFFSVCLFRDMAMASAERRLAVYVPVGTLTVLLGHLTVARLPVIGPAYRSLGFLTPGLLLGSVIGAVAALGFRFP